MIPFDSNRTVTITARSNCNPSHFVEYYVILSRGSNVTVTYSGNHNIFIHGDTIFATEPGTATLWVSSSSGHSASVNITVTAASSFISDQNLIMRWDPNVNAAHLGTTVPNGVSLTIEEIRYNASERRVWVFVRYGGAAGWVPWFHFQGW
jgi:hypothetical protein